MIALPTLRQLRYLQALHEHGHFGHAAEACHVTQSTLSAGLAELEDLLGAQLVERTKRRVLFTPLGNEVARRGLALLLDAEALVEMVRSTVEPLSGPFHLGVIPTIAPYLLPRLVLPCKAAFPHLQLYLREVQTARLIDELNDGQLDAGLLALPYPTGNLGVTTLGNDPFYLACPADHPLAARDSIDVEDLERAELLLLEDGHCLREHVLEVCKLRPTRQQDEVKGTSLPTVIQMVAAGLGVTLLPKLAVQSGALEGLGLVTRPLKEEGAGRQLALAWRGSSPRGDEFRALADFIAGIAANVRQ